MSCIQKYANASNNSQFSNRTRSAYVCKNFSWLFCVPIKKFSNIISHCRNTKSFRLTFSLWVLNHIYVVRYFADLKLTLKEENVYCNLNFAKFAKLKFRLLLYLESSQWELLWQKFKNQNSLTFNFMNLTNLSQVAKLNSMYIFIQQGIFIRVVWRDVYLNVNVWLWRHGHTLEANLKRSVYRFVYKIWNSSWWCHTFKTHVNMGI